MNHLLLLSGLITFFTCTVSSEALPLTKKDVESIPSRTLRGMVEDNIHSVFERSRDPERFDAEQESIPGETNVLPIGDVENKFSVVEVTTSGGGPGYNASLLLLSKDNVVVFGSEGKPVPTTVISSLGAIRLGTDYEGEIRMVGGEVHIGPDLKGKNPSPLPPRVIRLAK